ncbi:MAG TPA: N-acetyltransferase family protein [Panacibacter sp.]|nr:N-acetyltransferase family protein [Panacibacter sp.]
MNATVVNLEVVAAKKQFLTLIYKLVKILPLAQEHWPEVKRIYEEGIATGNATFQTAAPEWEEWNNTHLATCRLLAVENNEVPGWAALTPVSGRCVYAGVAEVSVYVTASARGKGVGKQLLQALINESEQHNLWTLQAGVFPENTASIKLHEACGFRVIGTREKIGKMNGIWRDTVLLERRSKTVGIN